MWLLLLQCMHFWLSDLFVLFLLRCPKLELRSCCLVWYGDCCEFSAFRLLKFVLAILSPVIARWLKSNRHILLFRPTLSGIVSSSISLAWIVAIVLSIARRHVVVSGISYFVSICASCVLPWAILDFPVRGAVSISLSATVIIAWSSVSIVQHVIGVSFKRPEKFVKNGSVICQELIRHVIHTSGATAGCPHEASSL